MNTFMNITIYNKDDDKFYDLGFDDATGIWITNQDEEGMCVDFTDFNDYLFNAIHKYFKEKY